LKILRSPFQDEFLRISDVPRLTTQEATVRVVGKVAGNILVAEASHFVRDILFILCDFCDLVGDIRLYERDSAMTIVLPTREIRASFFGASVFERLIVLRVYSLRG
jgi:hypothetical protein